MTTTNQNLTSYKLYQYGIKEAIETGRTPKEQAEMRRRICKTCDIVHRSLSRWENAQTGINEVVIHREYLRKMAAELNVTLESLIK